MVSVFHVQAYILYTAHNTEYRVIFKLEHDFKHNIQTKKQSKQVR